MPRWRANVKIVPKARVFPRWPPGFTGPGVRASLGDLAKVLTANDLFTSLVNDGAGFEGNVAQMIRFILAVLTDFGFPLGKVNRRGQNGEMYELNDINGLMGEI